MGLYQIALSLWAYLAFLLPPNILNLLGHEQNLLCDDDQQSGISTQVLADSDEAEKEAELYRALLEIAESDSLESVKSPNKHVGSVSIRSEGVVGKRPVPRAGETPGAPGVNEAGISAQVLADSKATENEAELFRELLRIAESESLQYGKSSNERVDSVPTKSEVVALATPASRAGNGVRGISNVGSTCYLSAVVQILSHSRRFLETLSGARFPRPNPSQKAFLKLVNDMWSKNGEGGYLDPSELVGALRSARDGSAFNRGVQEDAHDAISTILSLINEASVRGPREHSVIEKLFSIEFDRSRTCHGCRAANDKKEMETDLFVAVPTLGSPELSIHLKDLLRVLTSTEVIPGARCSACKTDTHATARNSISKASELLLISLKRFDAYGNRINTFVEYPTDLDLSDLPGYHGLPNYRLIGIIHHHGKSLERGHYTADYFHDGEKEWKHADDEYVTSVGKTIASRSSTAYILLYDAIPAPDAPKTTNLRGDIANLASSQRDQKPAATNTKNSRNSVFPFRKKASGLFRSIMSQLG